MAQELLYRQIADTIQSRLDQGEIAPGEQIPSVIEIRSEFSVSHITVLRALKELAATGAVIKKPGRGYFAAERSTGESSDDRTFGCLLRHISMLPHDTYFNEVIHGVEKAAALAGYELRIPPLAARISNGGIETDSATVEELCRFAARVDGLLLDERISDAQIELLRSRTGKPLVVVNRQTSLPVHAVAPDNAGAMRKLFRTLRRMGYDNFLFADSGLPGANQRARRECWPGLLTEYGIPPEHSGVLERCAVVSQEESVAAVLQWLEEHPGGKTVLVCAGDSIARGFCESLTARGVRIPGDLGLTGFDGTGYATCAKPELTTLKVDTAGIGHEAVQLLLAEIGGTLSEAPGNRPVPLNLIFGETI